METNGIIRRLGSDGEIIIPSEIRKNLNIKDGTKFEITVTDNSTIVLTKFNEMNYITNFCLSCINAMSATIENEILITDKEKVLASNKKKYQNKMLTPDAQDIIYSKEIVIKKSSEKSKMIDIFDGYGKNCSVELVVPILSGDDAIGSITVLCEETTNFDDSTTKICKSFAKYLSEQIL